MNNINDAKLQLKRDKHTLLEGYVSEFLFEQQFMKTRDLPYTHGWWLGWHDGNPFIFIIKETLSDLDHEIILKLSSCYTCWQTWKANGQWYFYKDGKTYDLNSFLHHLNITPKQNGLYATHATTDPIRQNKCIEFFEKHEIIHSIAMERNFADDILTVYFRNVLNIDYIIKNESGGITAVEVKFKNESYDGYFGINAGEVALFIKLRALGLKVLHCILYKTRNQKDMSIFDYLDCKTIPHNWYVSEFSEEELVGSSAAPQKTSVDGKKQQTFFKLPKDKMLNSTYHYKLKYNN